MAQADQNLYAYIKPLIEQGVPETTIRETLSVQGWPEDVVGATFESLKVSAQLPPPPPPPQKFSNPFIPPETTPAPEQDTRPMLRVPVYSALLGLVLTVSMFVLANQTITDLSRKFSGAPDPDAYRLLLEGKIQECNKLSGEASKAAGERNSCDNTLRHLNRASPEESLAYQEQSSKCSQYSNEYLSRQAKLDSCNLQLTQLYSRQDTGAQNSANSGLSVRLFVTGALVLIFWVVTLALHQFFKDSGRQFLVLTGPYYLVSIGLFLRLVIDVFRYLLNEAAGWGIYAVLILGIGLLSLTVILIQKYKKQLI